jgi:hypothetical protein
MKKILRPINENIPAPKKAGYLQKSQQKVKLSAEKLPKVKRVVQKKSPQYYDQSNDADEEIQQETPKSEQEVQAVQALPILKKAPIDFGVIADPRLEWMIKNYYTGSDQRKSLTFRSPAHDTTAGGITSETEQRVEAIREKLRARRKYLISMLLKHA